MSYLTALELNNVATNSRKSAYVSNTPEYVPTTDPVLKSAIVIKTAPVSLSEAVSDIATPLSVSVISI